MSWLLEKTGEDRPYYFTAYLGSLTFSADVNDAVQFARQQDARTVQGSTWQIMYEQNVNF